jgi:peptidyl-Asp metalloendopeptidase
MLFAQINRLASLFGCFAGFAGFAIAPLCAQEPLFRELPSHARLSAHQVALVELASASSAATGVKVMRTDPQTMLRHKLGEGAAPKITLRLSDRTKVTVSRSSVQAGTHGAVWRGEVEGTGGLVTLMWSDEGNVSGIAQHQGYYYSIRPLGDGMHAIVELDQDLMPPEHQPQLLLSSTDRFGQPNAVLTLSSLTEAPPATRSKHVRALGAGLPPKDVVIDVMVAYTKKAAENYNDIKSDLIALAIDEANESFRISGLGHVKLRLVHAYQTSYVEEGSHFDHVWRLAEKGDGYMDEVHGLRNKHRADVVILIVDDAQGCGLTTRVHPDADEAFAVVHHECAATTQSLGACPRNLCNTQVAGR